MPYKLSNPGNDAATAMYAGLLYTVPGKGSLVIEDAVIAGKVFGDLAPRGITMEALEAESGAKPKGAKPKGKE